MASQCPHSWTSNKSMPSSSTSGKSCSSKEDPLSFSACQTAIMSNNKKTPRIKKSSISKPNYNKAYEHNGKVPRDHWLTDQEKQAIIQFHFDHPLNGYRRLTYMMMDANIVACSPSTVHRLLSSAGLLQRFSKRPRKKGTDFQQPLATHDHLHIDVSYLDIR
jgi:hypothetical protein